MGIESRKIGGIEDKEGVEEIKPEASVEEAAARFQTQAVTEKTQEEVAQIDSVRARLGLPVKSLVLGALASTMSPMPSTAHETRPQTEAVEESQAEKNQLYYNEGIQNLYQHAEHAPEEARWAFRQLPDGRAEWIELNTSTPDTKFENQYGAGQISSFDANKLHDVIGDLRKGGSVEVIHSHPSKSMERTSYEEGFRKAIPPSPLDVYSMIQNYDIATEKGVEAPSEKLTFGVVSERGIWKYGMNAGEYSKMRAALSSLPNFSEELKRESHTDHGKALFTLLSGALNENLSDADKKAFSEMSVSGVDDSRIDAVLQGVSHPNLIKEVADEYERMDTDNMPDAESRIGEEFVRERDALGTALDMLYANGNTVDAKQNEGAGFRVFGATPDGLHDNYVEDWKKMGVEMAFTPREQAGAK